MNRTKEIKAVVQLEKWDIENLSEGKTISLDICPGINIEVIGVKDE